METLTDREKELLGLMADLAELRAREYDTASGLPGNDRDGAKRLRDIEIEKAAALRKAIGA